MGCKFKYNGQTYESEADLKAVLRQELKANTAKVRDGDKQTTQPTTNTTTQQPVADEITIQKMAEIMKEIYPEVDVIAVTEQSQFAKEGDNVFNQESSIGVQELFDSDPELANQVYEALGFKEKLSSITPKVSITNYRTMDDKSKEDAVNGVEEAQKRWVEEEIAEFYEAVEQYNKGLDTFSSKGVNKGKATIDDVIDETLGIFRTIQMFPKFSDLILPYIDDIQIAIDSFGRKEGYAIYKAKKDKKGQAKDMTYENLFEVVDKYMKPFQITPQQKQQALQLYSQYLESLNKPNTNPVLQGNQTNVEEIITQLEKDGLLEIDCKGKLKAEKGLATSFTKGGKWKVIKDLKGYPTHKKGGVDLTIGKDGVRIKNGNSEFTAKHGLVIPKN